MSNEQNNGPVSQGQPTSPPTQTQPSAPPPDLSQMGTQLVTASEGSRLVIKETHVQVRRSEE